MKYSKKKYIPLIGIALLLSACSEHDDLRQWMSNVKQKAIKSYPEQTVPSINAMATYIPPAFVGLQAFNPDRLKAGRQTGDNGPNMNRPKEILEAFGLEKLAYVGSLVKGGQTAGFIKVDDHIYTVNVGNYLGQDFGRIVAIEPDRIVLQEMVEGTDGTWEHREGTITRSDSANDTETTK
ncbi:pilus assembly protein PilP [Vitreoscilla massiliensis]|uniref:Pilus assembly protein PilP n=1 Tax=Vitreoscilla massiliensis TaxID=1689272 RepID=A0ABY4E3S3_9NEIS|nr:pilus assembly protein PilP [Vitreoscilla massiliensis]UOO90398.1 pilus assembly protein PilP [Vitreoscilla massiliensis]